jgi:glycosyltransferase involved in cell wall biosynthesis
MKVSFVIPTYNCVAWLPQAVESVSLQTHKDIELVIINDGSTDETADYLTRLTSKNKEGFAVEAQKKVLGEIKVITHDKPKGRSAARNAGNALASGDIICVLDADDLATENRAKWTVGKIGQGFDFVHGSAVGMDVLGRKLYEHRAPDFDLEKAKKEKVTTIVHSTVAYTKKTALAYPYREGEIADLGLDDWVQQMEMAVGGVKMATIPQVVAAYRILKTAISGTRDEQAVIRAKDKFLKALEVPA